MKPRTMFLMFFFLVFILLVSLLASDTKKDTFEEPNNIIGYIHICQKEGWKTSFDMLMESIRKSNLYNHTNEIRLGIINDEGKIIDDERLKDTKFKVIYVGKSPEYERPTLLHMQKSSETDPDNTLYYYLHTKGIQHFHTKNHDAVVKWINDMLDCNIYKWENAVEKLQKHETYGCNYNGAHYQGNFWWATKKHVQKLPVHIAEYYTAPEDYVLINRDNMYCARNCITDGSYHNMYPNDFYSK